VSDFDLRAKGASAINDTVCRWQEVTNEGGLAPPECTRPARWVSCVPFMQTPTCDEHKCRCAKPIEATNETGAVDESDAIDALNLSPDVTRILKQIRSEALTAAEQRGAAKERTRLESLLLSFADGFDCDEGANGSHAHYCRACISREALKGGE